jgi:hypothetical protein
MPIDEKRAERIITQQLTMALETIAEMRKAGLSEDRELELDFFFDAPDEGAAKALVASLETRDCLSLTISRHDGGDFVVAGKTYPTPVTFEVLSQWIPWMVVQGLTCNCEFDGFGAAL